MTQLVIEVAPSSSAVGVESRSVSVTGGGQAVAIEARQPGPPGPARQPGGGAVRGQPVVIGVLVQAVGLHVAANHQQAPVLAPEVNADRTPSSRSIFVRTTERGRSSISTPMTTRVNQLSTVG